MRELRSALFVLAVGVACSSSDYGAPPTSGNQALVNGCGGDTCAGVKSLCIIREGNKVCTCPLGKHEEGEACIDDLVCATDGSSCNGHGTCSETKAGGLTCQCDAANGYAGARCEECLTSLGFHKSADGKSCTQDKCDIAPSPCAGESDPNKRRCIVTNAQTSCLCDEGFVTDSSGKCVVPQVCEGRTTCNNRGNCSIAAGKVTCACDAGYMGALCTACAAGYFPKGDGTCFANPCPANPCAAQANTACVVDATKAANYRCDCRFADGFSMSGAQCVCAADANQCTLDVIQGGRCVHPANTNAACTDGDANPCTTGVCNASAQCAATVVANGTACGAPSGCYSYYCSAGTCYTSDGCSTSGGSSDGGGDGF